MPAPLARKVVPLLARCRDVKLDGAAIRVAAAPAGFFVRVTDDQAGFRLGLVRDPSITEVFAPGNFLALAGDMLHVWDTAWALAGADKWVLDAFAEIKKGMSVGPERVAWLVSELLPALGSRLRVDARTERLPELKEGYTPRVVVETAQAGESLMVLPTLVYGDPAVARVDGDRLVVLGKVLPRRDEPAEARARMVLKRLGLQAGQRVVRAGGEAIELADKLRASGVALRGEAHHAFKKLGKLVAQIGAGMNLSFVTGDDGEAREADPRAVMAAWQNGEARRRCSGAAYAPLPHDWLARYGPQIALLLAARGGAARSPRTRAGPGGPVRGARDPAAAGPRGARGAGPRLRRAAARRSCRRPVRRAAGLSAARGRLAVLPARRGARGDAGGRHGARQDAAVPVRAARVGA
jgi:hypothetical protein